jgi:hypothetical protein
MAVKVKELKDDALVEIKVNKNYYLMVKSVLFYLFNQKENNESKEASLKKIMEGKFEEMDDWERAFHTITLFLAEVEKQATASNLYDEKEILEPGDEGYVQPTQG